MTCSFIPSAICIGDRSFPLILAGQLSVHLPQTAHAYPSKIDFHENPSVPPAPKVSAVSKSGIGFRVPRACMVVNNTFTGAPTMCMCFDIGI